jgi:hypothetical protein
MNQKLILAIVSIVIEGALAAIKLMEGRRSKQKKRVCDERSKSRQREDRQDDH